MNEAVTKRFLLYFRLMLLVWILIANAIIHVTGLEYSWLIFLSNIMMFTLEGDVLWSSIFVTLVAKKYHESVTLPSGLRMVYDNH